jgi:uncharacterized membrane protein YhaH (DUF805 family)
MFLNVFQDEINRQNSWMVLNYLLIMMVIIVVICLLVGIDLRNAHKKTKKHFALGLFFKEMLADLLTLMIYITGLTIFTVFISGILTAVDDFVVRVSMFFSLYFIFRLFEKISSHNLDEDDESNGKNS